MQQGSHGTERLIAQSPDLLVRFDRQLRILFANPAAAAAVGCEPHTLAGRTLADIGIPHEQRLMLDASVHAVFEHGKDLAFEGRFRTVSGERYYNVQLVAEVDEGAVQSVWMASRDITRQKTTEKRLIESERRYRCLFENNLGLICTHDLEGRLLSVNKGAA
jgi:PAS domain S-box-containing protein